MTDFGATKAEIIEAIHAGANRADLARLEGAVWRLFDRVNAMPPRLSPELIAQLNALASRLTEQGEYDACDLIDTVVERVSAMPHSDRPPNTIPMPRDMDEARAMVLLGEYMLRDGGEIKEPERELLAEALDALTPFAVAARSIDVDPPGDHEPSHGRGSVTAGDLRRARTAADKIRAALEHQQKGEGL